MGEEVVKVKFVRFGRLYAQSLGQASGRLGGKAEYIGADGCGYEPLIDVRVYAHGHRKRTMRARVDSPCLCYVGSACAFNGAARKIDGGRSQ